MHWPNKLVLYYTRLRRLARDKYSRILGPVLTYKENEVLQIRPLDLNKYYVLVKFL